MLLIKPSCFTEKDITQSSRLQDQKFIFSKRNLESAFFWSGLIFQPYQKLVAIIRFVYKQKISVHGFWRGDAHQLPRRFVFRATSGQYQICIQNPANI